jgi:hypothetical protein
MTKNVDFHKREKVLRFERKNHTHDKPKTIARAVPAEQVSYEEPTEQASYVEPMEQAPYVEPMDSIPYRTNIDWDTHIRKIPTEAIYAILIVILMFIGLFIITFTSMNDDDSVDEEDGPNNWVYDPNNWVYEENDSNNWESMAIEYVNAKAGMWLLSSNWTVEYSEDTLDRGNYYVDYEAGEALHIYDDFTATGESAAWINKTLIDSEQTEAALANAETGVPLLQSAYSKISDENSEQGYSLVNIFEITPDTYEVSEKYNIIIASCDYTLIGIPDIFGSLYFIKEKGEPDYVLLYTEVLKDPLSTEYLKADLVTFIQNNLIWYDE